MTTSYFVVVGARSSCQPRLLFQWWRQIHRRETVLLRPNVPSVRHMGIFQEFSKRLKGELHNNPELKNSLDKLKEKAGGLKHRTKETTEQLYKHVDAAREEAEARARQVSAVVKEKVTQAKESLSEATTQVKESVGSFKLGDSQHGESDNGNASQTDSTGQSQSYQGGTQKLLFGRVAKQFQVVSSSARSLFEKVRGTKLADLVKEGYRAVAEELTVTPSKRQKKVKYTAMTTEARSSSTDIVPVVRKRSGWEKRWDGLKEKARAHPVYKRFKGVKQHPVVAKSQEFAEDMLERWETSDSPVVHKIQDLNESLFGETTTAMALKVIRQRDPMFSFSEFLAEVQESTRPVLQAYLKGDLVELEKRCSREVVDRCKAERRAYESQGIFFDNKILYISDAEVKETKLMGNVPIAIVSFQTQQIHCVRDKYGKITEGAKDDIQTVYYAWAMQLVSPEEMQNGEIYPRWQLREMQQLGIQAII